MVYYLSLFVALLAAANVDGRTVVKWGEKFSDIFES